MRCWRGYLSGARCTLAYSPADATSTHSCFSKIRIGFTFLVPAHPGCPGQRAVKRARVCACVRVFVSKCSLFAAAMQSVVIPQGACVYLTAVECDSIRLQTRSVCKRLRILISVLMLSLDGLFISVSTVVQRRDFCLENCFTQA